MNAIKTTLTEQLLETSYGTEFENHAQFILALTKLGYIGTRISKDDGIDGVILNKKHSKRISSYTCIYGPMKSTEWNAKKRKLKVIF